jgi:glucose-6-phosphate 1-dehydrogenase
MFAAGVKGAPQGRRDDEPATSCVDGGCTMTAAIGTLLVLGASGDLAGRLLLPAVGRLLSSPEAPPTLALVGAGTEDWDNDTWRKRVMTAFATVDASGALVDKVAAATTYLTADVTRPTDLQRLLEGCEGAPAIYFALPPAVTAKSCLAIGQLSLPPGTALVLEKPFGLDQSSAAELNTIIGQLVPEDQIHRVDHFLGKSTVLNLLGLRFTNRLLEPLWSADHIDRVDIIFDEPLALENRARYYDG